MNLRVVKIFSFLFFLETSLIFGATNQSFNEVCKNISSQKITKGSFNQKKVIKKINREIKSSGTFIVAGGEGLLWNTRKPFQSTMIITKSGIRQINAKGKKTIVSSNNNETFSHFSSLMTSLFEGDIESLEKNFEIDFFGSPEKWNVTLVPKDSTVKKVIESIEMVGNKTIDSMVLNEPTGDFTEYKYSDQNFADLLTEEEKTMFEN